MDCSNPNIIISRMIAEKLAKKHGVTRREVEQCFENMDGNDLIDNRLNNRTAPPTRWFIAKTNNGRRLKVSYVFDKGKSFIKSAYDPDAEEVRIYNKYGY